MEMKFTSENFDAEVLQSDKPVLVDFFADWCGPCRMMAPVIEKIAEEYEGKAVVGKLNVDESSDIAARYGVMTIPTLLFFKNGEIINKFIGVTDKKQLTAVLDQA